MTTSLSWLIVVVTFTRCLANNSTDIPECTTNADCSTDRVCARQACVDPCAGVCGPHTVCHVTNHVAMCSCIPGHSGHPNIGCASSPDVPKHFECSSHDQCPSSKACIQGNCDDPCNGLCGDNTTCAVLHHVPACACKSGYTGNAFLGCAAQAISDVCPPPPGKKRYYLHIHHQVDWNEALMLCLRNNSRLVSVDTIEEFEEIRNFLLKKEIFDTFWTSGSDAGHEGFFIWASTGNLFSSISDKFWLSGQPNNLYKFQHCVELKHTSSNFGLNDWSCNAKYYVMCEYYD